MKMKISPSVRTGFSFGLTSGIITTMGLIVGLHAGTHSQLSVIGGILTIAVADAFSDALGIHISQESQNKYTVSQIWESTIAAWLTKFIFAMTFLIPVLMLDLTSAIYISVAWGILILGIESYIIARKEKSKPVPVIAEHVGIALIVVVITNYVGEWISQAFI